LCYIVCLVALATLASHVHTFQLLRADLIDLKGLPQPVYVQKSIKGQLSRRAAYMKIRKSLKDLLDRKSSHHVADAILNAAGWKDDWQTAFTEGLAENAAAWYLPAEEGPKHSDLSSENDADVNVERIFSLLEEVKLKRSALRQKSRKLKDAGADLVARMATMWLESEREATSRMMQSTFQLLLQIERLERQLHDADPTGGRANEMIASDIAATRKAWSEEVELYYAVLHSGVAEDGVACEVALGEETACEVALEEEDAACEMELGEIDDVVLTQADMAT